MLIKLSWKNIITRPLSSSLSVILLASSLMIISLAFLTAEQLEEKFNKNANQIDLVVGAKGSRLQLVLCNVFHMDHPTGNVLMKDVEFLSKHPFVKWAIPVSLGDNYKSYRIVGTDTSFIKDLYHVPLEKGHLYCNSLEIVAGSTVAENLNLEIGSTFQGSHGIGESLHDHGDFNYKVVGILEATGDVIDQLLLTPLKSVWDVHPKEHSKGSFELKEKSTDNHEEHEHHEKHHHKNTILEEEKEITSVLVNYTSTRGKFTLPGMVNQKKSLMAAEPAIEIQQLFELIRPAVQVLIVLGWLLLFISIFSIFITLINSLKDRQVEIAMLRISGASAIQIFSTILLEGFMIAFIGWVFGFVFGHGLMEYLSLFIFSDYHYDFTGWILYDMEIWLFIGMLGIGMISALYPAIRAYRIDIVKTLKNHS